MKNKLPIIIVSIIVSILVFVGAYFLLKDNKKDKENVSNEIPEIVLRDNGVPRFIDGSIINTKVKSESDVFKALDEVKDMYGFKSSSNEFKILNTDSSLDITYYKLSQKYNGVIVYGYELVVAVDKDNRVSTITGNYHPNISISTYSSLSKSAAESKLKDKLGEDIEVLESDKYIYIKEDNAILTYIFEVVCNDGYYEFIIDASTGDVIGKIAVSSYVNYAYTGKDVTGADRTVNLNEESGLLGTKYEFYDSERNITIVDASNVGANVGTQKDINWKNLVVLLAKLRFSQGPISAEITDGVLTYNSKGGATVENAIATMYNLGVVYDYYKEKLGRTSYDNKGSEIIANIGVSSNAWKHDEYFNASWMGGYEKFLFGSKDGVSLGAALDVVAHEYTHGVIDYTANLQYQGESGALNESYADILGSLIEGNNFQIGETIQEMRDMSNPNKYNDPAQKDGKYFFPTDEEYYNESWRTEMMKKLEESGNPIEIWTDWDNGGVHTNSGVPNHAAYLMYSNGAFSSKEEMAKVWYNSLFLLTQTSDFEDCALAVIQSAKTLGLTEDKVSIIEDAFIETKMLARDYSTLNGTVYDEKSDDTLSGVLVTAINKNNPYVNYETYTNEKGEYSFSKIPTTDYTISFEKAKYKTVEKEIKLSSNKENVLDAKLNSVEEENYEKSEVIFVLDISASMTTSDPEDIRKQIMINILSSLDNETSVALVVFTAESRVINNGLSNKNVDKKILITDVFNIANDSGNSETSGTNGRSGLNAALNLFTTSSQTRKYIVFFTDGADNRYVGPTYDELIEIANDKKVRILTIGLGSDSDLNPKELEKIADETNGKYYHAVSSKDLYKFDKTIFEELK